MFDLRRLGAAAFYLTAALSFSPSLAAQADPPAPPDVPAPDAHARAEPAPSPSTRQQLLSANRAVVEASKTFTFQIENAQNETQGLAILGTYTRRLRQILDTYDLGALLEALSPEDWGDPAFLADLESLEEDALRWGPRLDGAFRRLEAWASRSRGLERALESAQPLLDAVFGAP